MQTEFAQSGISHPARLTALAGDLAAQSADARSAVDDPVYGFASHLPWLGSNLQAVRQVARAVGEVGQTMPASAALAGRLDPAHLLPHGGAIDITVVQDAAAALERTDGAVQHARALIGGVDRRHLVAPIASAVTLITDKLAQVSPLTSAGSKLGRIVVPMLGSAGPRNYVLAFQNLAEPRATGGIFGSYVVIHLDRGRISIGGQGAASRVLARFDPPVVRVDAQTKSLYTDLIARFATDVNFTPDFPSAASTFQKMYTLRTGQRVDGVLAIDPSVLGVLLLGRPAIPLGHGLELSSANVTQVLLSDIYRVFPTGADAARRDLFLAAATAKAFDIVTSGGGEFRPIISGIKDQVDVRRVLIWSAHPEEESQILTTSVGGRLPIDPVTKPTVGVFLNDGTGAKLGYYLDGNTRLTPGSCAYGGRELDLSVVLDYSAPASGLPTYVLGPSATGVPYLLRTNVMVFAPTGGQVTSVKVNGMTVQVRRGVDHGRQVGVVTVNQMPGQRATIDATLLAADPRDGLTTVNPRLVTTPGPRAWDNQAISYEACAK